MNTPHVSLAAVAAHFVVSFGLMGLCLFGAAGTLAWAEAWVYLAIQFANSLTLTVWMWHHDPALLKSRTKLFRRDMQPADRLFMATFIVFFFPYLLLSGLDAVRYGWSAMPLWLEMAGMLGVIGSLWMIFRVMQVNSFASPTIEVQKHRGHSVIDTGPYAIVRHPMYSAFAAYLACVPLALGSWWMLLPGCAIVCSLVIRIPIEERTLLTELDGYADYCNRVRYRLIPGIW